MNEDILDRIEESLMNLHSMLQEGKTREREIEAMVKHIYAVNKKNHESLKEIHSILKDMQIMIQDTYCIVGILEDMQPMLQDIYYSVRSDSKTGFHEEEWTDDDFREYGLDDSRIERL